MGVRARGHLYRTEAAKGLAVREFGNKVLGILPSLVESPATSPCTIRLSELMPTKPMKSHFG